MIGGFHSSLPYRDRQGAAIHAGRSLTVAVRMELLISQRFDGV